jgi:hypothetical protein
MFLIFKLADFKSRVRVFNVQGHVSFGVPFFYPVFRLET